MKNETVLGQEDGLLIPEVGPWTEDKFDLIRLYCQIFSTSMKNKWAGKRVYVDLYAGSGQCQIEGRSQVLLGSPMIALSVDASFDKYIFCENDPKRFSALKTRVERNYPDQNVRLILGDSDEKVEEICAEIPKGSLLAVQMDAKRNAQHYLQPDSKIDGMLGNTRWRRRWNERADIHEDFAKFLALEFARSMTELDYLETPLYQMREVKTLDHNVPLYYMAMFSKHSKAFELWKEVLKYRTPQRTLFE